MATLKEIVNRLAEKYQVNRGSIQGIDILEKELYSVSGIDRHDPASILLVSIDSPDLQCIGSACGAMGNRIFSNKSLVSFLKNRGVKAL